MGRRGRPRKVQFELEQDSIHSIAGVVSLLAALIIFLSFFGQGAALGVPEIQQLLNRIFGWGVAFLPLVLALSGLILLRRPRWPFVQPRVLTGLVLLWVSFLGLAHLFFPAGTAADEAAMGQGGGLLGFQLQKLLRRGVGSFGAGAVLSALFVISLLVLFNASLDETLIFAGKISSAVTNFFKNYIFRFSPGAIGGLFGRKEETPVEAGAAPVAVPLKGQPAGEVTAAVSPSPDEGPKRGEVQVLHRAYAPGGFREPEAVKETTAAPREKTPLRQETVTNLPKRAVAWRYPPLELLRDISTQERDEPAIAKDAQIIEDTLESFGIRAEVAEVNVGPSVTQYALEAASGTKLAKITTLQRDIAMALASSTGSVRIEAPIPGRSLIGIEVPNRIFSMVGLKSILTAEPMREAKSPLTVALGKDVAGKPQVADLARMPHVLVAGATGSGKSVLIHTIITSILFRATPEEVRFILADPKRVELTIYEGVPHLLAPVVVDPEKMLPTLKWAASEMDRRYRLFQNAGAKDIDSYNELSGFQALPFIVLVIDELADLMALAANEVEKSIVRLAQMSRATGIHLVLSTQRPSIDVLTGLIKANIPCRIALNATSGIDSRVILDQPGAEQLLGRGDMLYLPPEASKPRRLQGVYLSPAEIKGVVKFLQEENAREMDFDSSLRESQHELLRKTGNLEVPRGNEVGVVVPPGGREGAAFESLSSVLENGGSGVTGSGKWEDELFPQAVEIVCRHDRGSASLLQRRLSIGYARAARLLDDLEAWGVVGPRDGAKPRDILIKDPSRILGPNAAPPTAGIQ